MNEAQKALDLFNNGLNCAQSVLSGFCEQLGIDSETAKNLGRPWGGGVGRMGQMCGALSGAIMVLGLSQGSEPDETQARKKVSESVRELVRRFEQRNGTALCRELLGADVSTKEGQRKIKEDELAKKLCPKFVKDAAEILGELL
jgi:C_GCAxxG_C_C family probable redox protein